MKVPTYNSSCQVIDALAEREGGLSPIRPQEGMLCIARFNDFTFPSSQRSDFHEAILVQV